MLFPSSATAKRCQDFLHAKVDGLAKEEVRIVGLVPSLHSEADSRENGTAAWSLFCVFFPKQHFSEAKQVWQHSGDGISSRRGEFCLKALRDGLLLREGEAGSAKHPHDQFCRGPRRYQPPSSQSGISVNGTNQTPKSKPSTDSSATADTSLAREGSEFSQFVEERFGRNLNAKLASKAKTAICRRIAGCLTTTLTLITPCQCRQKANRVVSPASPNTTSTSTRPA